MKKIFSPVVMVASLVLSACASPTGVGTPQPSSSDQVATIVAATMQAFPSNTPVLPDELLPHTLYYLGKDGRLTQVYRIERDGKTVTQLTFEPNGVDGYDVLPVDGTLAFIADNQLSLVNADGSNRRVLVDGGPTRYENDPRIFKDPLLNPVFSPDGQTIAYSHRHKGEILYNVASGVSKLAIEDDIYTGCSPVSYSPDGTKLLVKLGHWEAPASHAVYSPETDALVRPSGVTDDYCCSDHRAPVWSPDSSSFYGVCSIQEPTGYQFGEVWKVDAGNGAVIGMSFSSFEGHETLYLPVEPYFAPDGQLYFFFGTYTMDSGYSRALGHPNRGSVETAHSATSATSGTDVGNFRPTRSAGDPSGDSARPARRAGARS